MKANSISDSKSDGSSIIHNTKGKESSSSSDRLDNIELVKIIIDAKINEFCEPLKLTVE